MKPMQKTGKTIGASFVFALIFVWVAACIASYVYAHQQHIPYRIVWLALPALLAELMFYLTPGFESIRKMLERVQPKAFRALLVTISGVIPYLLLSTRLHAFSYPAFGLLVAMVMMMSFWYVVAKPIAIADIIFLVAGAAVYLSRAFAEIFPNPAPHAQLMILGRLMWIRVGITSVLSIRGWNERYGFLPDAKEWRAGIGQYFLFLPAGGAIGYLLRVIRFQLASPVWWKVPLIMAGTFFAFLWVTAMAEEFVFRGFLQQMLARAWNSNLAGLIVASLIFGAAHLPFRGFPNWKWAALASVLGLFCGIAYWRGGSVRASMVTHALAVATLRGFFTG